MMAVFIALTAVAVERYINRRRLRLHEVLADVGWLTLVFAFIEFAYLFFAEAFTLNYGTAARPLWYTEWPAFKNLLLDAAVGVFLILTSVWIEAAGIRIELRRPQLRPVGVRRSAAELAVQDVLQRAAAGAERRWEVEKKCDIEWHEAS